MILRRDRSSGMIYFFYKRINAKWFEELTHVVSLNYLGRMIHKRERILTIRDNDERDILQQAYSQKYECKVLN